MMKNNLNLTSIIFALVWLFVLVRSECNPSREVICKEDEWKCADKRQCIANSYLCDKMDDCIDGSDEQNCEIVEARAVKRTATKSQTSPAGARKCGQPAIKPILTNSRVIGGIPARPHSWPWHVYLYDNSGPNYNGCSGTIINETTVLTAAHCLGFETTLDKNLGIAAGSHNLLSSTDGPYQRRSVTKIIMIDEQNKSHDIAILILSEPLVFNDRVSAICLPKTQVTNGQNCYVSGYGNTQGQLPQTTLNQAKTPIVDWHLCQEKAWGKKLTPFYICAGYFEGKVDACNGDSGGPLTCQMNDSRWYLNGIVSSGGSCARPKYPGIYANVYLYIDWIVAKTGFTFE